MSVVMIYISEVFSYQPKNCCSIRPSVFCRSMKDDQIANIARLLIHPATWMIYIITELCRECIWFCLLAYEILMKNLLVQYVMQYK